jgi:stage II sporulation protein B
MDKHRQEITVRINGKESPFTMDKPKQLDKVEILENRIDENAKRVGSLRLNASLPSINKKRNKSNRWNARAKSAIISIVIAIIVGTSFGFIVLNMIPKQKAHSLPVDESALSASIKTETSTQSDAKRVNENEAVSSPFTISVIQAGVFSDDKTAASYAKQLKSSSIPVVTVGKQPVALLIGVGQDKETLRKVSQLYGGEVQSTYIKSLSFANADSGKRTSVIEAGEMLYMHMASVSAVLLGKSDVKADVWKELENDYKQFAAKSIPNDKNVKQYVSAIKDAYLALVAYKTNQQEELLRKTQQKLLEALQSYMAIFPLRS